MKALTKTTQDQAARNRRMVMAEIMLRAGISRTAIGEAVGLNVASVSRITRDLIDAGLVRETDAYGPKDKPGRRFVGLAPRGEGGFIVGIGMNAFRQSVTLADLENRKIDEWVAPDSPGADGEAFIRLCLGKAAEMLSRHVPDRRRFFGVGITVAAELDKVAGKILQAPIFGWADPVDLKGLVAEILDAPLVLDSPPSAINKAEGDIGLGRDVPNLVTLHCSLGFGIGVRHLGDGDARPQEFGRTLTQSHAPDRLGHSLSESCGGLGVLREILPESEVDQWSSHEQGPALVALIARAAGDARIRDTLRDKGRATAQATALLIDVLRPQLLLLAGPLAQAPDYVAAFEATLAERLGCSGDIPRIRCTDMTPTGASRWLALRGNVAMADLKLGDLKGKDAA